MAQPERLCKYCGDVVICIGSACDQCVPFVGRQEDTLGLFLAEILARDGDPLAIQLFDQEFLRNAGIKPD